MKTGIVTISLMLVSLATWAQSSVITPNSVDLHIDQETSRDQLAEMQQSLQAVGIGFRYDLVSWEENAPPPVAMTRGFSDKTRASTLLSSARNSGSPYSENISAIAR